MLPVVLSGRKNLETMAWISVILPGYWIGYIWKILPEKEMETRKMDELITVVVPAYNCAPWLPRCLDSLLAQTYPNLEIVVVNDGSTDDTKTVLDDYAARCSRVTAVHQKNAGEYAARLSGVAVAKGNWIGFVDADDETEPHMYAMLMNNALKHNADISHCGYKVIYPDGRIEYQQNSGILKVQDAYTGVRDLLEEKIVEMGLCSKLFRKELFSGIHEWMDYSIVINGDMMMNYYLFSQAEKSVLEDVCPYHYLIRQGSASRRKLNEYLIYDPIRVRRMILDACGPDLKDDARRALARMCLVSYRLLAMETEPEYKEHRKRVREIISQLQPYCGILPKRNAVLVRLISNVPWVFDLLYPPFEKLFRR